MPVIRRGRFLKEFFPPMRYTFSQTMEIFQGTGIRAGATNPKHRYERRCHRDSK